jgi:hypothetical protein
VLLYLYWHLLGSSRSCRVSLPKMLHGYVFTKLN